MRRIEYNDHWTRGRGKVNEPVGDWLESSLDRGGLESQIEKSRRLLVLMVAERLERHPEMLEKVAKEIDYEGWGHALVATDKDSIHPQ